MEQRRELRSESGRLVGILVGGTALEIKRGCRMFTLDVGGFSPECEVVIFERILHPDMSDEAVDNAHSPVVE